jgi:hypothetical protein
MLMYLATIKTLCLKINICVELLKMRVFLNAFQSYLNYRQFKQTLLNKNDFIFSVNLFLSSIKNVVATLEHSTVINDWTDTRRFEIVTFNFKFIWNK